MNNKISSRYREFIIAFLMSFNTAFLVSGVITFINTPSINIFLQKWLPNFIVGWPLAFLSIIFIAPLVYKFVDLIVE
jgi:hypothetical protein